MKKFVMEVFVMEVFVMEVFVMEVFVVKSCSKNFAVRQCRHNVKLHLLKGDQASDTAFPEVATVHEPTWSIKSMFLFQIILLKAFFNFLWKQWQLS